MRKSLVAAAFLACGLVGRAQEKPMAQMVIQASPEQIKRAALAMFARSGYRVDASTGTMLRISQPFTREETDAYNTAHWMNPPEGPCRHVQVFALSPVDHSINVGMSSESACGADGKWIYRRVENEKETQWMQTTLAHLKAHAEQTK